MDRVRALEEGSGGNEGHEDVGRVPMGLGAIDTLLGGGLRRGAVHEWVGVGEGTGREEGTEAQRHKGTKGRERWTAPVCVLTHLARRALRVRGGEGRACVEAGCEGGGAVRGWVVWVGRRVWPYGRALVCQGTLLADVSGDGQAEARWGVDDALLRRSIFVDAPDDATRLWAMDLALRCAAIACVVGEGHGFDVAATRRLQLGARAGRTLGLLARPPTETKCASVASSRWLVGHVPTSGADERAHEHGARRGGESDVAVNPRWIVELVRCKGVRPSVEAPRQWGVEWCCETGHLSVVADVVGGSGRAAEREGGRSAVRVGA